MKKGVTWPNPRFTDNDDGTVTDNLTGLIWLQDASCIDVLGGVTFASEKLDWAEALTWSNAMANGSCSLTDGSTAGDWRLPNMKELQSLIDFAFSSPALSDAAGTVQWTDGDAFTGVQSGNYWSSTTSAASKLTARFVFLFNGSVSNGNKTVNLFVWPVRGGQ